MIVVCAQIAWILACRRALAAFARIEDQGHTWMVGIYGSAGQDRVGTDGPQQLRSVR